MSTIIRRRKGNRGRIGKITAGRVVFIALLLAVLVLQLFSLTAFAAAKKPAAKKTAAKKAKKQQVKLLVASYDHGSIAQARNLFVRAGASVDTTTAPSSKINVSKYDGLIVPGSCHDVVPSYYGQKNTRSRGCFKQFDIYRFRMIKKFVMAGKPVYGICGGVQSINVCFGGSLIQHINGHMGGVRTARISKRSINYKKFGSKLRTYHCHHQCPDKVAPGFIATEWDASDGHIEAIQHIKYPIYGVQYHPEFMGGNGVTMARMFISICRKYRNHPYDISQGDLSFIKF